MSNWTCFMPSSLRHPPQKKEKLGNPVTIRYRGKFWCSELWINTTDQGDLAQLRAMCTFSHSPYQLHPFAGSRSTNSLRCKNSTETETKQNKQTSKQKSTEINHSGKSKQRLPLQVLFFCSPSTLDIVKALHSNFRVFLLWTPFAPPLLYSTPFPPPLGFWVKGKQFLLSFSCPAFL